MLNTPSPLPNLCHCCSGVPPDAFSATGQLWGSPLYDWQAHAKEGFAWWRQRMARHMQASGVGAHRVLSASEQLL